MNFRTLGLTLLFSTSLVAHADFRDGTYSGHQDDQEPCSLKILHKNAPNHTIEFAAIASEVKGHVFSALEGVGGDEADLATDEADADHYETLNLSFDEHGKPKDALGMGSLSQYSTFLCSFEKYLPFSVKSPVPAELKEALNR